MSKFALIETEEIPALTEIGGRVKIRATAAARLCQIPLLQNAGLMIIWKCTMGQMTGLS